MDAGISIDTENQEVVGVDSSFVISFTIID